MQLQSTFSPTAITNRVAERPAPAQNLWGSAITAWLARMPARLSRARAEAEGREELMRMSDRDLRDIGLTRADIPSAVRGEIRR